MYTKVLTTAQLAARWGRPEPTLRQKISLGIIPHVRGFHRPFLVPMTWIAAAEAVNATTCKQFGPSKPSIN